MHEGQWQVDIATVERLVAEQFPAWRGLPVIPVHSDGTVNALFRVGHRVVVRFALLPDDDPSWPLDLLATQEVVARLATRVAVQVPVLLGVGVPGAGYPGYWTAYEWIPGETVQVATAGDTDAFASDLAAFVAELHRLPVDGRT